MTDCIFLRLFARICGGCGKFVGLFVSLTSDTGLHFQILIAGPLHDLVFALLQGVWRVHVFCNHAYAGLAVGCNDLIL